MGKLSIGRSRKIVYCKSEDQLTRLIYKSTFKKTSLNFYNRRLEFVVPKARRIVKVCLRIAIHQRNILYFIFFLALDLCFQLLVRCKSQHGLWLLVSILVFFSALYNCKEVNQIKYELSLMCCVLIQHSSPTTIKFLLSHCFFFFI